MTGKTIQIFLPDGDPSGIRIAEITTRIVQAVAVPRSDLPRFFKRKECDQIGAYCLFGGTDTETKPVVYVGQTEDLQQRLKSHDAKKEFWTTVVILISSTARFTQAHIRWLEWRMIAEAEKAGRFRLENGNAASGPFVTEPMAADLEEIFETGRLLIEALGFPLFRPLASSVSSSASGAAEEFRAKGPSAEAVGLFTPDGFVVRKGSRCRVELVASAPGEFVTSTRERLLKAKILAKAGNQLVFQEDVLFKSPSGAAAVVLGRSANGWTEWKDRHGRTLHEVKRGSAN